MTTIYLSLRLGKNKVVEAEISSDIFCRRMKERLMLLNIKSSYEYSAKWENSEVVIENSDIKFLDIGHRSSRQNAKIKLGGFVGELTIHCENKDFWKDLQLLEYMHIGSNTQAGYGNFEIESTLVL